MELELLAYLFALFGVLEAQVKAKKSNLCRVTEEL